MGKKRTQRCMKQAKGQTDPWRIQELGKNKRDKQINGDLAADWNVAGGWGRCGGTDQRFPAPSFHCWRSLTLTGKSPSPNPHPPNSIHPSRAQRKPYLLLNYTSLDGSHLIYQQLYLLFWHFSPETIPSYYMHSSHFSKQILSHLWARMML